MARAEQHRNGWHFAPRCGEVGTRDIRMEQEANRPRDNDLWHCRRVHSFVTGVPVPDLQLIFVIALVDDHARKLHMGHGISCHVDVLRPYSRGTVNLTAPIPRSAPDRSQFPLR